jgi:glycosyltransferase involved in cell wall biosynthesis
MPSENSLSVIIPALNEERTLEEAVTAVLGAVRQHFDEYEIIIVDDGSTDTTGTIAERMSENQDHMTVVHHDRPRGLGGSYKKGLSLAKMHYVTTVNGKNDTTAEELSKIWALKGKADIIVPYQFDPSYRPLVRRIVARLFTLMLNTLFGLNLRYYNHYVLHKRALVNTINIRTNSHAFQAEALVKLIKKGHSFVEIGHLEKTDDQRTSRAFRVRNVWGVAKFFFWAIYDVYITGGKRSVEGKRCHGGLRCRS